LLLARLPDRGAAATLTRIGSNSGVETWQTADDVTLSFREGVLVASRGLGGDLMTADVTGTLAVLRGTGAAAYPRPQTTLDGDWQIVVIPFRCRIADRRAEVLTIAERVQPVQRLEEVCTAPGREVRNLYWQGADGFLWATRQWVGDAPGSLETERLIR